jgi:hypothetical protein
LEIFFFRKLLIGYLEVMKSSTKFEAKK